MDEYIAQHCSEEHPYLHALWRATHLTLLRPRMASGHVQGTLLRQLVAMQRPTTVVEIGTFSGYAALAMASALEQDDAHLYTFEINDEQEAFTRRWIDESPWADKVDFILGDVVSLLPEMALPPIDFAFVDANKRDYATYYHLLLPLMRRGAVMLADNTLWNGFVCDPSRHDAQTTAIRQFNDMVAADARVESLIIPLRDGLTLIRKIAE